MSKAYLMLIYIIVFGSFFGGIIGGIKIIRNERFAKWQDAKPVAQEFMKKHERKFDVGLKCLFTIVVAASIPVYIIPGFKDIPNVLHGRYEIVEGYALNHAGNSDSKMPKSVTIKPEDGEEIRLRFYSGYAIEEGEYLKVIYLPNLKRGTLLEKGGVDGSSR